MYVFVNITRQVERPRMAVATVKARDRCRDLRVLADQDNGTDGKCGRGAVRIDKETC
jgi:hypothetical protein